VTDPPGEADLRQLAGRFDYTERQIRGLLARAPNGDRRAPLAAVLGLLVALRQLDMRRPVIRAYLIAFTAVGNGGELREPRDLAASLHMKLDQAAVTASQHSRGALRTATADNLEETTQQAVTAYTDAQGKRWPLGAYASMETHTIGRHASSRGTLDAVGPRGHVTVSSHGTHNPICLPLEGETFPAATAPQPPFHPHCKHYLRAA
jgi:hypothetical protein